MSKIGYGLVFLLPFVAGLVGGAISSLLLIGGHVFAQKADIHQKVVAAEEFRLVDKEGRLRAKLGVGIDAGAYLNLWGKDQKSIAVLEPSKLDMIESDRGHVRLAVGITSGGTLKMWDKDGNLRAILGLWEDGSGLTLYDKDLKRHVTLGNVKLQDAFSGMLGKLPAFSVVLFGEAGKVIWSPP